MYIYAIARQKKYQIILIYITMRLNKIELFLDDEQRTNKGEQRSNTTFCNIYVKTELFK